MEDGTITTYDSLHEELVIRTIFVEELPVELPGEEPFLDDAFVWFCAKPGEDSWWVFGLSDALTGPEEMMQDLDPTELGKYSIFLGDPWESIMGECPHCVAKRHGEDKAAMSPQIYAHMMETPDERLAYNRDLGRFLGHADFFEQMSGLKMSLN